MRDLNEVDEKFVDDIIEKLAKLTTDQRVDLLIDLAEYIPNTVYQAIKRVKNEQ